MDRQSAERKGQILAELVLGGQINQALTGGGQGADIQFADAQNARQRLLGIGRQLVDLQQQQRGRPLDLQFGTAGHERRDRGFEQLCVQQIAGQRGQRR